MRIAVAGGTGMVGSKVVERLRAAGDDVVVLSRGNGVDLVSGDGLAEALAGVQTVVDCSNTPSQKPAKTVGFFTAVAKNLQKYAAEAGVGQVVTLSIVGIDGMEGLPHYAGKLAQEAATKAGRVPFTILRATQFHEFGGQFMSWMRKGPLVPAPIQPVQTVAVDTVAEHLARLAHEQPAGAIIDLAGPQRSTLAALVRRTAERDEQRVLVVPLWLPGATARLARSGNLQAGPDAIIDGPSLDEWLSRPPA